MKRIVIFPACLLVFFLFETAWAQIWTGKVVAVIDGDTIEVMHGRKRVRIRLYGIDTPEYGQPYSGKAKRFTARLVQNRWVEITEKDVDKYGRTVALVRLADSLINAELVDVGLARVFRWFCREQPLCTDWLFLEERARREKRGLWRTGKK